MLVLAARTVFAVSTGRWILIAFLALFSPFMPKLFRQAWDGTHPYLQRLEPPGWWPWGERAWRGFRRCQLVVPVAEVAMVLAAVSGGLIPVRSGLAWVPVAFGVLFVLCGLVCIPLMLFARPRFLVPPVLRDQHGGRGRPRRSRAPAEDERPPRVLTRH